MALNDDSRDLMMAVATKNMAQAKSRVRIMCVRELTKGKETNKAFCDKVLSRLNDSQKTERLPYEVSKYLYSSAEMQPLDERLFSFSQRDKALIQRVKTMQVAAEKLRNAGIPYRNSILLYGPTGTGKTSFVKFLAKELNRELLTLNLSGIFDSLLGQTSKNIGNIFKALREQGGDQILFLDELDTIVNNRQAPLSDSSGPEREVNRITMALMQELDLLPPGMIVVAATNCLNRIDSAAIRRFSIKHELTAQTYDERLLMIEKYLRATRERLAEDMPLAWNEEELAKFAEDTLQANNGDIINAITQSVADAFVSSQPQITFSWERGPTSAGIN